LGRTKSSHSVISNNTFSHGGNNLEITGLQAWLEGPMLIDNVSVVGNTIVGAADANRDVRTAPPGIF